jgi:hypothetical protein
MANGGHLLMEQAQAYIPATPEGQYEQAIHDLLQPERRAQLLGQAGDPNLQAKLTSLSLAYYSQVLYPLMKAAETDCAVAEGGAIAKALSWERQVILMGLVGDDDTGPIDQAFQQLQTSLSLAIVNCWNEVTQPCLNRNDRSQMRRAFTLARQAALLGIADLDPDAAPVCVCAGELMAVPAWMASFNLGFSRGVEGDVGNYQGYAAVTVDRQAVYQVALTNKVVSSGNRVYWTNHTNGVLNLPSGTALVNDAATHYGAMTHSYSVDGGAIVEGQVYFQLDLQKCLYEIYTTVDAAVTSVSDGSPLTTRQGVLNYHSRFDNAAWIDLNHIEYSHDLVVPVAYGYAPDDAYHYLGYGDGAASVWLARVLGGEISLSEVVGVGHAGVKITALP